MTQTARGSNYQSQLAKQSAEGTAQGTPLYSATTQDGSIEPTNDEQYYDVIDTEELQSGVYIASVGGQGDPVYAGDVDLLAYLSFLFLGAVSGTGTTDAVNTITRGTTPLFASVYQQRPGIGAGAGTWERHVDSFLQKLELRYAKGQPIWAAATWLSKSARANAAAPTATNDRRIKASGTKLVGFTGATLKLDVASQSPSQIRNIEAAVVTMEWAGAEWIQTDEAEPRYLDKGELRLGCSVDAVLTDYNWLHGTFFGAASTPSADAQQSVVPLMGSIDFQAERFGAAVDAARNFRVQLTNTRFHATPPKPSADGKAVRISLAGTSVAPASGVEPITVTAKSGLNGSTGW